MDYFWRSKTHDNKGLVGSLQKSGMINSKKVADVMEQVDRGLFVPPNDDPYVDSPVPIGYNATISAPHMHASCLELLLDHLQPGMHALDVGAGTGYLTAIFSLLVGESGRAVGVEHIPELTDKAIENIKKSKAADLLASGCLTLLTGDGREGCPQHAPYNAIHVGAAALEVPRALIDQLKPGGRMVIPVGDVFQDLMVIDKDMQGQLKEWSSTSVRYVPLTDRELQLGKGK
jgi:protein-L-isoaspartate(D-aspartate) O-methyltransferase